MTPIRQTLNPHHHRNLYLLLALISGAGLPIQANLNGQLARSLDSVVLAAAISYLVGFLALIILLSTGQFGFPHWSALSKVPRWSLMGGLFGAWYIAQSAYLISILGTTLTLGFLIGGQAITGMIIDHYGWLAVKRRPLNGNRRLAVGLLIIAIFWLSISA